MGKHITKVSKRGVGECGNPFCTKKKAPDSFLCRKHTKVIRDSADEASKDPKLTYNQRSTNPNRQAFDKVNPRPKKPKRAPKTPTCCTVGCFEPRVPGEPFCDGCASVGMYD